MTTLWPWQVICIHKNCLLWTEKPDTVKCSYWEITKYGVNATVLFFSWMQITEAWNTRLNHNLTNEIQFHNISFDFYFKHLIWGALWWYQYLSVNLSLHPFIYLFIHSHTPRHQKSIQSSIRLSFVHSVFNIITRRSYIDIFSKSVSSGAYIQVK